MTCSGSYGLWRDTCSASMSWRTMSVVILAFLVWQLQFDGDVLMKRALNMFISSVEMKLVADGMHI